MPGRSRAAKVALSLFLLLSACSNVLESTAGKTTDGALYEDALKAMNKKDYTTALANFSKLGGGWQSRSDVMENWAYAYAGDCGLDFIAYFTQLQNAALGGTTFFKFLMNAWTGIAINPASCTNAQLKMEALWASSGATASQQLFMSILGLVKMGVYVRSKADVDGAGNLGDGSVDAAYGAGTGSCNNAVSAHTLTDPEIQQIVTGLAIFIQNLAGLSASLSASMSAQLSVLQTACGTLTPNPCNTNLVANVDPTMIKSMRDLLESQIFGIGTCALAPSMCCP